jgi:hypothetical protein
VEWLADEITEAGGEASIWLAQPASAGQERDLAARMAAARAAGYSAVTAEAQAAATAGARDARRTGDRQRTNLRRPMAFMFGGDRIKRLPSVADGERARVAVRCGR